MLRYLPFTSHPRFLAVRPELFSNTGVVQTGSIHGPTRDEHRRRLRSLETFSVITSDIVPLEDLAGHRRRRMAFNDMVNGLIVEAMQAPPVCLTLIDPEDVTDDNQP